MHPVHKSIEQTACSGSRAPLAMSANWTTELSGGFTRFVQHFGRHADADHRTLGADSLGGDVITRNRWTEGMGVADASE